MSTLIAAAILPLAAPASGNAAELAAMLALLVAICFVAAWVARLGWIADYLSRPVLIGYIHGVAVVLVIGQLGKLLGLSISASEPAAPAVGGNPRAGQHQRHHRRGLCGRAHRLLLLRLVMPRLPTALLVVAAAIAVSWALGLQAHGVAVVGVSLHREARLTQGIVVYRLDDRLFFANARYFQARVHEAIRAAPTPVSWLVFDAEAVTQADSTGLEALTGLANDLRHEEITLVVARLRSRMQEQFQLAGVTKTIGSGNFYPSVHAAVDQFPHTQAGAP